MNATSTIDSTGTGHCVFNHPTCSAELRLNGAHITHWQPAGEAPVIFMSPKAIFAPGTAIRGGVPICLPWFGPHPSDPKAPAHGLVRTQPWQLVEETFDNAGWHVHLRYQQKTPAGSYWTYPFDADFVIGFGHELTIALSIKNVGDAAFDFSEALHAYYKVGDVRNVTVTGLQGIEYLDKHDGGVRKHETAPAIEFTKETDRVYVSTTAACTITDPQLKRKIIVEKQNSQSTVIWNPFEARASQMNDLGADNWPGFACVESANAVDNIIKLLPSESHTMSVRVRVEKL